MPRNDFVEPFPGTFPNVRVARPTLSAVLVGTIGLTETAVFPKNFRDDFINDGIDLFRVKLRGHCKDAEVVDTAPPHH